MSGKQAPRPAIMEITTSLVHQTLAADGDRMARWQNQVLPMAHPMTYAVKLGLRLGLPLSLSLLGACRGTAFSGDTPTRDKPVPAANSTAPATPGSPQAATNPGTLTTDHGEAGPGGPNPFGNPQAGGPPQYPCSSTYTVKATANPYLAGTPNGTTITYAIPGNVGGNPNDAAPEQAPVLVVPMGKCMAPGRTLTFQVQGMATYAAGVAPTDANGDLRNITTHQKNALYGKSNITAPFNSLIAVFLGDGDPSANAAPAPLDFSQPNSRDYASLSPLIGQVFFIGNGKTRSGGNHRVVVPAGSTRLYFAIMDGYQWNNNAGSYTGAALSDATP